MRLRRILACFLVVPAVALASCSTLSGGVYNAPLPGGADVGDDPITLTVEFEDVLDLVPQSAVKVDNVDVGRVTGIHLSEDGHTAEVELLVHGDVDLPSATTARLEQTSLLGEKYVALVRPDDGTGQLRDGALLTTNRTDAAAEVEQVFGALSMVLNGGGIGQFQEISRELQAIGDGRTDGIQNFLHELRGFVSVLDERKDSITKAIDGLAALSDTLEGDREKVAAALEGLSPGMRVLAEQRPQLVKMLKSLDRLSEVTVDTLDAAQDDIVADLKALDPVLDQLAKAGANLPHSLEILLTYPFPDSVLAGIRGDFLNSFVTVNFSTPEGCAQQGCFWPQVGSDRVASGTVDPPSQAPNRRRGSPSLLPPTDSAVPGVPTPTVPGSSILPEPTGSSPGSPPPTSGSGEPSDTTTPTSPTNPPSSGGPTSSPSATEPSASASPDAPTEGGE